MPSLYDLPNELLLQILANVTYNGGRLGQLRGVCKRFDQLTTDPTLPEQVARAQFQSLYLFDKALHNRTAYQWTELNALYAKSQAYERWQNLLPASDRQVLMPATAFLDAVQVIQAATQNFSTDLEESVIRDGLNLARLVREVVPVQALVLLRYLSIVTDDALQAYHYQNPTADFSLATHDSTEVAVNCLCKFAMIETRMLSLRNPPYHLFADAHFMARDYDNSLHKANEMRRYLEGASYNPRSPRDRDTPIRDRCFTQATLPARTAARHREASLRARQRPSSRARQCSWRIYMGVCSFGR